MKSASRLAALVLGASLLASLGGCELAEESADKLARKAEEAAQEIAREAIGDAVNELNKKVDDVQASARELLNEPGRQKPRTDEEPRAEQHPGEDDERMMPPSGVET